MVPRQASCILESHKTALGMGRMWSKFPITVCFRSKCCQFRQSSLSGFSDAPPAWQFAAASGQPPAKPQTLTFQHAKRYLPDSMIMKCQGDILTAQNGDTNCRPVCMQGMRSRVEILQCGDCSGCPSCNLVPKSHLIVSLCSLKRGHHTKTKTQGQRYELHLGFIASCAPQCLLFILVAVKLITDPAGHCRMSGQTAADMQPLRVHDQYQSLIVWARCVLLLIRVQLQIQPPPL